MPGDPLLHLLLTLPDIRSAYLSPDGRWVAFAWYRIHPNLDVFLVPSDGSALPVALSNTPEATNLVGWTADSRAVILSEDHASDERLRLFRVDIDPPGVMAPLTEDHPPYFIRGGDLDSARQVLYYGANYDFGGVQSIDPTWIYRHDLRSGQRTAIAQPARPCYSEPKMNQAGTHLIYARKDRHPAGRQFYLVDVNGSQDREILNFGDTSKVFARWLPDSQNILVISDSTGGPPQQHISLGIYHWPSEKLCWLVDDPQRTIEGAWASPDGAIIVDEVRQANHAASFIDPLSSSETPFPEVPGNLLPVGRAADGSWIAMYYSATRPTELVRFSREAHSPDDFQSLTHVWDHTGLDPAQLVAPEAMHWPSVDGLEIQGWLYRAIPNPRRAVITIHGGPTSHAENRLNPQIQYLVRRGFNVLDVNYRGSTGFGLNFREAIKVDGWGGREQADIASGAEALIRRGLAEPGRVGVTGTSYGGYSAWHQITHYPPDLIGAAAPICGMTDLVLDYATTRPDLRPLSEEMLGGNPEQAAERYFARSPINFVQNIRGKLLIVQGAQDPNVSPENVRQVVARLENQRIPYELLVFEDEGHGIRKPANQEQLYLKLAEFFEGSLSAQHSTKY